MNIIFDLDGTLLDSKQRLFDLFCKLCKEAEINYQQYWSIKREGISHSKMLTSMYGYTENEVKEFSDEWMKLIETDEFTIKDVLYPGVIELLDILSSSHKIHLCTARQRIDVVSEQLIRFGIAEYFTKIIVTEQQSTKSELIRRQINDLREIDFFVSDTGADIKEGKCLGIKTCAITHGFLNKEVLQKYSPDHMVESVTAIIDLIN